MPTNCPQHPNRPALLAVEAHIPGLIGGSFLQLACTNTCAADLRASYHLAGAHPDHIDTRPATADDIAEVTGMEVAV